MLLEVIFRQEGGLQMRTLVTAILITMLACAAVAQNLDDKARPLSPAATKGSAAMPQAPIGHRQPTEKNLPPHIRKDETTGNGVRDPLGPLPQLCKGC